MLHLMYDCLYTISNNQLLRIFSVSPCNLIIILDYSPNDLTPFSSRPWLERADDGLKALSQPSLLPVLGSDRVAILRPCFPASMLSASRKSPALKRNGKRAGLSLSFCIEVKDECVSGSSKVDFINSDWRPLPIGGLLDEAVFHVSIGFAPTWYQVDLIIKMVLLIPSGCDPSTVSYPRLF